MNRKGKLYTAFLLIFFFSPILVLVIFSFNSANSLSVLSGFSLHWYKELLNDSTTLYAVRNTIILAVSAALISTVMGTAAAVGINKLKSRYLRRAMDTVTNIPMINPDIITGVSMMLMFVFTARFLGMANSLNFVTILIAHVTFCLPYVILQVLPKLNQMDKSLPEAAMDLGCKPLRAFIKVVVPEIMPGIITGMLMAFTLSLDDFVISYFTTGAGFETLPIRIYGMTKRTVTPKMYALATIIFFTILVMLILRNLVDPEKSEERADKRRSFMENKRRRIAVEVISCVLIVGLASVVIFSGRATLELNVLNQGEYISDGSDGSLNTNKAFEKWYYETYGVKVKVNYSTAPSVDDMYAKVASDSVSYDVIVPSDFIIDRMRQEGRLQPLNFDNIPNYENISDSFRGLYYDPDDAYSVPYFYGNVAIIYDANRVDEDDVTGWEVMWSDKYAGEILQFNNARDAIGTAQYKLGLDVNSTDKSTWDAAIDELQKQKPLVKSYVMDEIYNMMEAGEAQIAAYYVGDYFTMRDAEAEDVDLCAFIPERTNYFIDAFCIPTTAQNKDLAEAYINFMLSEEAAMANAEYVYYACPNKLIYENEDYIAELEDDYDVLYAGVDTFNENFNTYAYRSLDRDTQDYENSLWEKLKIN